MKIIKNILIATFLVLFNFYFAQKSEANTNKTGEIEMTQSELNSLLNTIKEKRKQRILAIINTTSSTTNTTTSTIKPANKVAQKSTTYDNTNNDRLDEIENKLNFLINSKDKSNNQEPIYNHTTKYYESDKNALPMVESTVAIIQRQNQAKQLEILQNKMDSLKMKFFNQEIPVDYKSQIDELNLKIAELKKEPEIQVNTIAANSEIEKLVVEYSGFTLKYFFLNNSSQFFDNPTVDIKQISSLIASSPYLNVQLKGYASTTGNPAYNVQLSKKRSETIKTELIKNGVPQNKIEILPLGEDLKATSEESARRVELSILVKRNE